MAETMLLNKYLKYFSADIYTCMSVEWKYITSYEANYLNNINEIHSNFLFGRDIFIEGKDYIVRSEDVYAFYKFMKVCYNRLLCKKNNDGVEKCGFILINGSIIPYCKIGNKKYVPLFFFENENGNLVTPRTIEIKKWDLAYLKFCFIVLGIREELFAGDSCKVTSIDNIMQYFPPETSYKEYWPISTLYSHLLIDQNSLTHGNQSGAWIITPPQA